MAYVSQPGQACSPVCLVQLHDPLLQLPGLVWGEAELADIVAHVLLGIMVTQFSLHGVGAQQGVRDEGARQAARDDVCPQLQAQVAPSNLVLSELLSFQEVYALVYSWPACLSSHASSLMKSAGLIDIRNWNTAGRGRGIWQAIPTGCQECCPLPSTLEEEPSKH